MDDGVAHMQLAHLKKVCAELLRLAKEQQWERLQLLETQWARELGTFFEASTDVQLRAHEEALRELMAQHQALVDWVEAERESTYQALKRIKKNQQGIHAYKNH